MLYNSEENTGAKVILIEGDRWFSTQTG